MRKAKVLRETRETQIELEINLDGSGRFNVSTPVGFLTHMVETFARHGRFDLELKAKGDVHVSHHHTVEDVGITLGMAVLEALGDKKAFKGMVIALFPWMKLWSCVALIFLADLFSFMKTWDCVERSQTLTLNSYGNFQGLCPGI